MSLIVPRLPVLSAEICRDRFPGNGSPSSSVGCGGGGQNNWGRSAVWSITHSHCAVFGTSQRRGQHRQRGKKDVEHGERRGCSFPQSPGAHRPPSGRNSPNTLQISTLLAASSISSLRASALAPEGCRLLARPEDFTDCCHLQERQQPVRAVTASQRPCRATTVPRAEQHGDNPSAAGI